MTAPIIDVCDEVHGIRNVKTLGLLVNTTQLVTVSVDGNWVRLQKSEGTQTPAGLTPAEARYLATKLRRCATIVEQRRKAAGQA